jgi:hypothetical protein
MPNFSRAVLTLLALCLSFSCASTAPHADAPDVDLAAAERMIDAFYSFDPAPLRAALASAESSVPVIAYYQGWAEGGHYQVLDRQPCRIVGPKEASCSITVKDDLIVALGLPMHVTDTFHVTFDGGRIVGVRTSSNDPPMFMEAFQWVKKERAAQIEEPCRDFFKGGPTPQLCVQAMVRGFAEFAALPK